jgi:tetratricopeptide (TPR) repeat protein
LKHSGRFVQASFLAGDCRALITLDQVARVWNVSRGAPVTPLLLHRGRVVSGMFSPDGRRLITTSDDGTARVWDAVTGEPVTPSLRHGEGRPLPWVSGYPNSDLPLARFSTDGSQVVIASWSGVQLWDLRADARPVEDLVSLAGLLSGERIDATGGAVPLPLDDLDKTWKALRSKYPEEFTTSPPAVLAWRGQAATECEAAGEWSAALVYLKELLALDHANWTLHMRQGRAFGALGQWDQAAAAYTQAVEAGADDPAVWVGLGGAHAQLSQWENAVADFEKALELKPDQADLCNTLAWLLVAGPKELRDGKKAVPYAERAVKLASKNWYYHNTLGLALYRADRYQDAIAPLEASLKGSSGHTDGFDLFFLSMCYAKIGNAAKAKGCFDRAVKWVGGQKNLSPQWAEELKMFRTEAEELLRAE